MGGKLPFHLYAGVMSVEQPLTPDGGRAFYGCILLLWLITAPPLWLLRLGAAGGVVSSLELVLSEAIEGRLVGIYLLLSPLMLAALPLWIAHERRHRQKLLENKDVRQTFN